MASQNDRAAVAGHVPEILELVLHLDLLSGSIQMRWFERIETYPYTRPKTIQVKHALRTIKVHQLISDIDRDIGMILSTGGSF